LRARGTACKRHERNVARALDGHAEPPLMTGANAGHAAGKDLPALLHELRENVGALVVDEVHLLDAKLADFLLAEILALTAPRSARTSAARSAFAARAAMATSGSTVAAATFATRSTGTLGLFLFLCHTCLPFRL
jgi:hypothetical protein